MKAPVGISETKEMVAAMIAVGNAIGKNIDSPSFDYGDFVDFVEIVRLMPSAMAGVVSIPAELKDLEPAERIELCGYIEQKFDIPADMIEHKVELALKFLLGMLEFVNKFVKVEIK